EEPNVEPVDIAEDPEPFSTARLSKKTRPRKQAKKTSPLPFIIGGGVLAFLVLAGGIDFLVSGKKSTATGQANKNDDDTQQPAPRKESPAKASSPPGTPTTEPLDTEPEPPEGEKTDPVSLPGLPTRWKQSHPMAITRGLAFSHDGTRMARLRMIQNQIEV